MRTISFICVAAVMIGCTSTPKVVTDVTEILPPRKTTDVVVYDVNDSMPANARSIGKLKVTDGGFTPTRKCQFVDMLSIALGQTAESGGNALHIDEHRYPDLRSTCHRIWGTMYIIPDSIVNKYPSQSIQEVEERYDEALLEAMVATQLEQEEKRKKELDNPKNVIMVNAGVSWITSEIQTPFHLYKNHVGFGMNVDYQHIWGSGLGLGIDYLYYNTSFDGDITYNTHYIGPSIVGSMMSRNSLWRMNLALGIGYAYNTENVSASIYGYPSSKSESSVGVFGQIGAEYKLAKHVGVGVQLSYLTMRLDRPEGYDTSKYKFYGVKRFDLMAGLRFYL